MSRIGAASPAAVPVSNARAETSRRNGAESRGPKTLEGKARSAQNALKHGLRAQKYVVLPEEDAAEFAELEAAMIEELAPVGALQTVLARRVAVAAWRLARADRLEVELFAERRFANGSLANALIRDGNGTRSFETLLRYRGAAMAEFWRALRTLKALQAEQAVGSMKAPANGPATQGSPRVESNEPKRRAALRIDYLMPDPPVTGPALHEPAELWTPSKSESGPPAGAGDISPGAERTRTRRESEGVAARAAARVRAPA
jgi:hypothetical protein